MFGDKWKLVVCDIIIVENKYSINIFFFFPIPFSLD